MINDRIGHLIKVINCKLESKRNKDLMEIGLTSQQIDFIMYITTEKNNINQKMIEEFFKLKNSTVSGILDRLEKNSWIIRKTNPNDKRCNYIYPTEKALALKNHFKEKIEETEKRIVEGLSDEEIRSLKKSLALVIKNLEE